MADMVARRRLDFCCLQETRWKGGSANFNMNFSNNLKYLLSLTLGSINNRVLDILDPENVGIAVGISFRGVTEPELHYCI